MLEKTGTIRLTSEDLIQAEKGIVSQRVKDTWNLSHEQLQEVIQNKAFTTTSIGSPQEVDKTKERT